MGQCISDVSKPSNDVDDVSVIWSHVLMDDYSRKCHSVDMVYHEKSRLNFKKRHKYRRSFQKLMSKLENHVTVKIEDVELDEPIYKTQPAKSSEHLDFNEMFDGKPCSKGKITPDYNYYSSDTEGEHENENDTKGKTYFDEPKSDTFIPIHRSEYINIQERRKMGNKHESFSEYQKSKHVGDFHIARHSHRTFSTPDLSGKYVVHRCETDKNKSLASSAVFSFDTKIKPLDSGYLTIHDVTMSNHSKKENCYQTLKHTCIKELEGCRSLEQNSFELIKNKREQRKLDNEHTLNDVSEKSCAYKFLSTESLLGQKRKNAISERTRKDFIKYYIKLLKDFFKKQNIQVDEGKSRTNSKEYDYVKKFDEYLTKDCSLSTLGERGKEGVFKLLSLGVELARYNHQHVVYPIDGLQEYFVKMSVPVASRPSHADTMIYEWVRVRSFWSFPSNIRVSPLAMARVGFYFTGKYAECQCFCCGAVYREWRDGDDPYVIHQQISPNCPYLNGQESGNVPIHEEDRLRPRHHVDPIHNSNTASHRTAGEAEAILLPGLNSAEIARIPVPSVAGQGRSLGTSQSGDFSFNPQSSQAGFTTQPSGVNRGLPSYFSQTPHGSQNVGLSAFTLQSSDVRTSTTQFQSNASSSTGISTQSPHQFQILPQGFESGISGVTAASRSSSVSTATVNVQLPTPVISPLFVLPTPSIAAARSSTQPSSTNVTRESVQSSNFASRHSEANTTSGTSLAGSTRQQTSNATSSTSPSSTTEPPIPTTTTATTSSNTGLSGNTGLSSNTGLFSNTGVTSNTGVASNTGTSSNTGVTSNTGVASNTGTSSNTGTPSGTEASSNTTLGAEPSRSRFDPLGINFEKPRYPAYAVLTIRVNTYNGWPSYLDQTPRTMAKAGFFYTGHGDYTRCFFCGGGLRNWEAGDDPWVEHARWFPKCAFVRQNRGDNFVNMVQTTHQEAESPNQAIGFPRQQSVLDEERPANIMSSIAVQTLREMGKDDAIITEAINRWRAVQHESGQTNNYTELQATEIYEIILQIENERSSSSTTGQQSLVQQSGTRQTTGHQSSLVQQTGTPQTTGHLQSTNTEAAQIAGNTNEQPTRAEGISEAEPAYLEGFDKVLKEYEEQKERLTCTICMENPVAIAFLPCGHLVCCLDCAPAMRRCPVCQEIVKGTIKTFFP